MAKKKTTPQTSKQESPDERFKTYCRVQLAGRCVADPELRYTPTGKSVCRMRVATNDTREAQFHSVIAWEALADSAAQALRKGTAVLVEGRLQTRSWEAADGTTRSATEIVASAVKAV
jgi:single-strand DNA-binding protein